MCCQQQLDPAAFEVAVCGGERVLPVGIEFGDQDGLVHLHPIPRLGSWVASASSNWAQGSRRCRSPSLLVPSLVLPSAR